MEITGEGAGDTLEDGDGRERRVQPGGCHEGMNGWRVLSHARRVELPDMHVAWACM